MKRICEILLNPVFLFAMVMSCGDNPDIPDPIKPPDIDTTIIDPPIDPHNPDPNDSLKIEGAIKIIFDGEFATIENPYEDNGVAITVNGADVVVKSTWDDELTYILTGTTPDGSFKIYSDFRYELVLNGVDIIKSNDPALNIQSGKRATVTLVEGTNNRLVGGMGFISEGLGEDVKAAFFSEGQLVFNGKGSLTVISRYRHAICSDDYIRIDEGHISIPVAATDGIHANEYIEVNGGTLDITSIRDGLEAEKGYIHLNGGTIKIKTTERKGHGIKSAAGITVQTAGDIEIEVQGEASKGFNCKGDMCISQGFIHLTTSGDAIYDPEELEISSAAGIKCDGNLVIDGGNIHILSSGAGGKGINVNGMLVINDGEITAITTGDIYKYRNDDTKSKAIKSNNDLTIKGGLVYAYSAFERGMDPNGSLTIAGGTVVAIGSSSFRKGFDYGTTFTITGGTLLGIGGTASSPTANLCTQNAVVFTSAIAENTLLNIASSEDKNILTFRIPCALSKASILFGSPDLVKGARFTISSGGSVSGGTSFNGIYNEAIYTGGNPLGTFTISSTITNAGSL